MWSQNYDPLGNVFASAALASAPVVVLLALLAFWQVRALWAALAGLGCALLLAIGLYRMPPAMAFAAAGFGALFGFFPIGWIILNAIFIYDVSVHTAQFEVLKQQVAGLAGDRRMQTLLIAFSFGAFIEGAAGFGTPVAITGALLIGLGFAPLEAAVLALIGNTAPVAFGALGIPLITLSKVTGLDLQLLSSATGRILPIFSLIIPFWLIVVQAGWRGMLQVWPACLVTGASFAITQWAWSNFQGPALVDLMGAAISMSALLLLLRFWRPPGEEIQPAASSTSSRPRWRAWVPWITLTLFVFAWGLPKIKAALALAPYPQFHILPIDKLIQRMPPVVSEPKAEEAVFKLDWLSATGTALLFAGLLSGLILGVRPLRLLQLYARTIWRVRVSLLTIGTMLALGYTARYSGSDTTMGLAFAHTGILFPFFSPLLGWLGVALTGSDTSSNVLFGNLQQVTAQQLGLPAVLMAAANSAGGVMGKMIDAQSIVVAGVATSRDGAHVPAGTILRRVFWHSLALATLVGIWVLIQAYAFPSLVPR
ncbi:MAG TPA: lactate permease LctP family transporter [Chthoniobacteraceae bacterium]|jgi:lactate permease